jgi:AcrR family transcriptional regulator
VPKGANGGYQASHVSDRLLDAAMNVLVTEGWDGLSLQSAAERAGLSRVTAWRQAASKEQLVAALTARLAADYQETLWPVLTAPGDGAQRLTAALRALCDVADRHLSLLLVWGVVPRRTPVAIETDGARAPDRSSVGEASPIDPVTADDLSAVFAEPLARLLRDGGNDGSLVRVADAEATSLVLFNAVCHSYVNLRARHDWSSERARGPVLDLVLAGLTKAAPTPRT